MKPKFKSAKEYPERVISMAVCLALVLGWITPGDASTITKLDIATASSLSVSAQNQAGQLTGSWFTSDGSAQRAFLYNAGVVYDLGTLGGANAVGNAINASGQVAGYSTLAGETQSHACLLSGGVLNDLGSLGGASSAAAVNDSGQVAGTSYLTLYGAQYRAFLYASGMLHDLGTLGGTFSSAVAINNSGQVAGDSALAGDGSTHAFLYTGGVLKDIGTLGGSFSSAFALNNSGQMTGDSSTSGDAETHAYLYSGGAMNDLGTLGGTFSTGRSVNEAGEVIGNASLSGDSEYHGFIFSAGAMHDLGTLGGNYSAARALNNLGQVVGVSFDAGNLQHAFLWKDSAMIDLNTLLPANSDWELADAFLINDAGQIVGYGYLQGQFSWYIMTLDTAAKTNHPPVADAGPDQIIEGTGATTVVVLDGSHSSDADGDALTFEWREGTTVLGNTVSLSVGLTPGSHTLTLKVTDPSNASSEDTVSVRVGDTTPPVVVCPEPVTKSAHANGQARVPDFLANLVASDNATPAGALVKTQSPAAGTWVGLGTHVVTVTVTDAAGNHTTCAVAVTVVDRTPPEILCLTASPDVLSPDDHKMIAVTLKAKVKDNCDPSPVCRIVSVRSSDPVKGGNDHTSPDWLITGDLTLKLRAETTSHECARVYTIKVVCTDAAGNHSAETVRVTVRRHRGHG